jgi:3-hydroxyisobutyrate dehydrogenase
MTKIAFLGLGAMGSRMAANLIKAGHALTVWNRDAAKAAPLAALGAAVAATPAEAVAGAEIAIAMLRDDEASRRVWLEPGTGALAALPQGAIVIESSTLTVGWARELAEAAQVRGLLALDAPVAGSRPQAEAGQLIFLAGGDAVVLAQAEPILRAMGGAVHHAGPTGAGAAIKLGVNALFGIQVAAMAEILGLLAANGVDRAKAVEIIGATPVASPAAKGAAASMLAAIYQPMFPVELVEKDFGYIHAAGAAGAGVPMADAARAVMQAAMARGLGEQNLTSLAELYR